MPKITWVADYHILCPDGQKVGLAEFARRCRQNSKMESLALLIVGNINYGNIDQYYVTDHPEIHNIEKVEFPFWFIKKERSAQDESIHITGNAEFVIEFNDVHMSFSLSILSSCATSDSLVTIICDCKEYRQPINKLLINGQPVASYNHDRLVAICQSKNYTISCVPDEVPKVQRLPKFYVTGSKVFISNKGKYNISDELLEFLTDQGIVRAFAVSHSVFSQELYDKLAKYKLNIEVMFDA